MIRRDNIAAAKQRLKEQPAKPEPASSPPSAAAAPGLPPQPPAALAPTSGFGYPPQYYGAPPQGHQYPFNGQGMAQQGTGLQAYPPQMQEGQAGAYMAPAPWPRTSLLDPMQAAFGAAYDGYNYLQCGPGVGCSKVAAFGN